MRKVRAALSLAVIATGIGIYSQIASANVGEAYGFGSRSAALAGNSVAWGFDGFAAYQNPAALGLKKDKRMTLSVGLLLMDPSFTDINNVVTQNNYMSDKTTPVSGSIDTDYRSTFGNALGVSYTLFPDLHQLTFGLVAFIPINQVAYMDTGETFLPEYVLYRSRTQRPQFEFGLGANVTEGLYFGLGLHLGYILTSNASAVLQTPDADKSSSMRFSASLKPKVAPYLGVLYAPEGERSPATLGAVFRFGLSNKDFMDLRSATRIAGFAPALDLNLTASSTLYYDPKTIEVGMSWQHSSNARFLAQADYQLWGAFEAPSLVVVGNPEGVEIDNSSNPVFEYRNILVPRVGEEIELGNTTLRLGYGYRPSFIKNLPTGAGNYLDPPKHMLNAGVGFLVQHFLNFEHPCELDFHISYHALVTQHVTKDPGDETGSGTGDLKAGAPGYDAGGRILGGGASLTLAF